MRLAPAADSIPHQPVQYAMMNRPTDIDLQRDRGLTITWADGSTSFFTVGYLRKMSPSADARQLRQDMEDNPLTVLPNSAQSSGPLTAEDVELVGNYAIRIRFSDGHDTGIYSWEYLRELDAQQQRDAQETGAKESDRG